MKSLGEAGAQSGLSYRKIPLAPPRMMACRLKSWIWEVGQSQPCDKRDQLGQLQGWDGFVRNLQGVCGRLGGDLSIREEGGVTEESRVSYLGS